MTQVVSPDRTLLSAVDALCLDLQRACGLTRLSIVLDRAPRPLTISFENELHAGLRLAPTAYLEIELRAGADRLGYVTVHNALATSYSPEAIQIAHLLVARHTAALRDTIPT